MTVYTTLPTDDLNLAVTVIDDPDLVQLNITPAAVNITSAVTSVNGLVGNVTLTTTQISEGTNEYFTNARTDARVDLQTGANLDLSFSDTDDLAEGPTNLYYTAARDTAQFNTDLATKDTDDLTEGSNLYYTAARDTAQFDTDLATKTTTNLTEGTNLYYTAGRDSAQFNTDLATKDTDDLTEGSNLYYTDSRFDSRLATKDTDDLTEGSNLYYTDARAQTVITANTEAFIKADSTDTLSNKSGNISMFTNDAGYLTTETDNQTLSFASPNLTISNGNSVNIGALTVTTVDGGTY